MAAFINAPKMCNPEKHKNPTHMPLARRRVQPPAPGRARTSLRIAAMIMRPRLVRGLNSVMSSSQLGDPGFAVSASAS